MKTDIHVWSHLAQLFLEWQMFFQKKVTEKIKTHIFVQHFFFNVPLWDNAEKYCRTGQARDDKMVHAQRMLDS